MSVKATATKPLGSAKSISSSPARQVEAVVRFNSPLNQVMNLHQTLGNREVQRLFKAGKLQAALKIGQPNDIYEQEADRMADRVMRMEAPQAAEIRRQSYGGAIQRMCDPCSQEYAAAAREKRTVRRANLCPKCASEENLKIQRKPESTISSDSAVPDSFVSSLGAGQPLDRAAREYFEPRFGADFSQVRVHAGRTAAESASSINALAYTLGHNVVFGAGQYQPNTLQGKRLLAHELTHVVQQSNRDVASNPPEGISPMIQRQNQQSFPYDSAYGPSSSNCAAYQSTLARNFLTWTYRHNATCACENTPNNPKNNCVRKCLQVKMNTFLSNLNKSGGVIGSCIDPIGLLDFTCPEPYCSDLYNHHVECYRECGCTDAFIGYPAFWFMCEAPYPCFFVKKSIAWTNACT